MCVGGGGGGGTFLRHLLDILDFELDPKRISTCSTYNLWPFFVPKHYISHYFNYTPLIFTLGSVSMPVALPTNHF